MFVTVVSYLKAEPYDWVLKPYIYCSQKVKFELSSPVYFRYRYFRTVVILILIMSNDYSDYQV